MKKFIIIGLFAALAITFSCKSSDYSKIAALLPEMSGKADGVYRGNYNLSGTPVKVKLDVTVQDNKITGIEIIKHTGSRIGRRAEIITERIIEKQSLSVDAVSGATGSSTAILKAVENALQ